VLSICLFLSPPPTKLPTCRTRRRLLAAWRRCTCAAHRLSTCVFPTRCSRACERGVYGEEGGGTSGAGGRGGTAPRRSSCWVSTSTRYLRE
jgi:hypothetical protein